MKRDTFIPNRFYIYYISSHCKYDISNIDNSNNSNNIDSSTLKKDTPPFFKTSFLKNILRLYILLIFMIPFTFCKSRGRGITGNLQTKTGDPLILRNNRLIIQKHNNKNNHRNNRNDNHNTPLFELENESKLIFRDKGDRNRKKYVHIRNKNLELTSKEGLENLDFKRQTVYSVRNGRKGRSGVLGGEEVVFVPNNNSNSNSRDSRSSRSSRSRGSSSRNRSKSKSRRRDSSDAKSSSSSSHGSSNQRDGASNRRDGGYDSDTSSALNNQRSDSSDSSNYRD